MQKMLEKWSQSPGWLMSRGVGNGTPTLVFLSGEIHRQRSLAGNCAWGRKQSDTSDTQRTQLSYHKRCFT